MDSLAVFKRANRLVRRCGTRDARRIAEQLGIRIYYADGLTDLLGMYTARWNHRIMILHPKLDSYLEQMVIAHELGHDALHRQRAKVEGMKEFVLFQMKDNTEYEANAFAAHLLLSNDEVCKLAQQNYDVVQIAQMLGSDINLMLIKLLEMNKLGYDFRIPYDPDSRFFRNIKGSSLAGGCYE